MAAPNVPAIAVIPSPNVAAQPKPTTAGKKVSLGRSIAFSTELDIMPTELTTGMRANSQMRLL
jgi:hypothetical protein